MFYPFRPGLSRIGTRGQQMPGRTGRLDKSQFARSVADSVGTFGNLGAILPLTDCLTGRLIDIWDNR